MLELDQLRLGDAAYIVDNLRDADRIELEALGFAPAHALTRAIEMSKWVITMRDRSGRPLGVAGLSHVESDTGAPWMLATNGLYRYRHSFWHHAKDVVDRMNREYRELLNVVDSRNVVTQRWLERLGFEITHDPITMPSGVPFYLFRRIRPCSTPSPSFRRSPRST